MKALRAEFEKLLAAEPQSGSAVAVYRDGREVISLCGGWSKPGEQWKEDTPVPVFSATKAVSAACLLNALAERGRTADMELWEIWPACYSVS